MAVKRFSVVNEMMMKWRKKDFKERALAAMYGLGESGNKWKNQKSTVKCAPGKKRRAQIELRTKS